MFGTKVYTAHNNQQVNAQKRKSRNGDWMCINCSNYNYAFRVICNRCRMQTKQENDKALDLIGKQNYGQRSFPSVLFLTLGGQKSNTDRSYKSCSGKLKQGEQEQTINNCLWVQSLIDQ